MFDCALENSRNYVLYVRRSDEREPLRINLFRGKHLTKYLMTSPIGANVISDFFISRYVISSASAACRANEKPTRLGPRTLFFDLLNSTRAFAVVPPVFLPAFNLISPVVRSELFRRSFEIFRTVCFHVVVSSIRLAQSSSLVRVDHYPIYYFLLSELSSFKFKFFRFHRPVREKYAL